MAFQEVNQQSTTEGGFKHPTLARGDKAWLRSFGKGDLLPYWKAINDPEIAFYTGHCPPVSFEEIEFWYQQEVLGDIASLDTYLTICQPGSDTFVGTTWLWHSRDFDGHCQLTVFISDKSLWDTGIGSEAVRLTIDYAFKELGLEKVWLHVDVWNERAIKCYENCGFEREGVLRKHRRLPDGWSDMAVMSVLRGTN